MNTQQIGTSRVATAIARMGWIFRPQPEQDHGIDGHIEIMSGNHAIGRLIAVQIKCGTSYFKESSADGVTFRCSLRKAKYWIDHTLPVLIVLVHPNDDRIIWQHASPDAFRPTGKDVKIFIPILQSLDHGAIDALESAATPLLADGTYSQSKISDLNLGQYRGFSLRIVIHGSPTRTNISVAARTAIADARRQDAKRSDINGRRPKEVDHILAFLFLTPQEERNNNWVCRCEWSREGSPAFSADAFKPNEHIGQRIVAHWAKGQKELATFIKDRTLSKFEFIEVALPLAKAAMQLEQSLAQARNRKLRDSTFTSMRSWSNDNRDAIRTLYNRINSLGFPPAEGEDLLNALDMLAGYLDNIPLIIDKKPGNEKAWLYALDIQVKAAAEQAEAVRVDMRRIQS